jgi:heme exporter protein D
MQFECRLRHSWSPFKLELSLSVLILWISFLEMRQKRFYIYLALELAVIPAVILIFKLNPERRVAALQAGTLFVGLPLVLILKEVFKYKSKEIVWFLSHGQFLLFFAIPILGLRVANWDADFSSLMFLGMSGKTLHGWSNKSFILMLLGTVYTLWKTNKKAS